MTPGTPWVDLDALNRLVFLYDGEDDIASLHIGSAQPAISEQIDDAWYLRLDGDRIVGMELHGLERTFLSDPFYAKAFTPALQELRESTGRSLGIDGLRAEGSFAELPSTARLLIFLIGVATAKYQRMVRDHFSDTGRDLLAG